jgi:TolA-binding protein
MNRSSLNRLTCQVAIISLTTSGCSTFNKEGTLGSLQDVDIEIKEEVIVGSLEKALESYQRYLEETPETAMTPEAIRRLADLKIEKEYSATVEPGTGSPVIDVSKDSASTAAVLNAGSKAGLAKTPTGSELTEPGAEVIDAGAATAAIMAGADRDASNESGAIADITESERDFSERATKAQEFKTGKAAIPSPTGKAEDLQVAGAMEAIELYKGLLVKYPLYERNDQVMYQLSRAYEETGQVEKAIDTLNKMVVKYPNSRHLDEAHFRRAEYFFTRKRYLDAEEAYQVVLDIGRGSAFYELALYKQGWAFFKQELYEEALKDFIAMLDFKLDEGFELEQIENKIEKKRIDDTYRVISLSFSYLGGADAIVDFFTKVGPRSYEASVYSHLGEYYLDKRRYNDAALSYNSFVERNPLHKVAPYFNIRVIEIYLKGGFPKLVIESKKDFSNTYGLNAEYWGFFDIKEFPVVLSFLKSNLSDLANHYHALYQDKRHYKKKQENYAEAIHWYKEFFRSFPQDELAPELNYKLAALMLENKDYRDAALEYESTAYNYPRHDKSSEAGYAAVYAYRQYLAKAPPSDLVLVKREIVRSSLKFVENFPEHKNAPMVLSAAADMLYELKNYTLAVKTGRQLIQQYPDTEKKLVRSAWLVVAHGSFDQTNYQDAEVAYLKVLELTDAKDESRTKLTENLAASIYKQGEQQRKLEKHREAADHFLRIATVAPTATIRPTAEYDAAAALIILKDWPAAIDVLVDFRKRYPENKLQQEVTKKLAVVYKENGDLLSSARQFERIEKETGDESLKREALEQSAELYVKAESMDDALRIYNKYVKVFPRPVESAIETRQKIADIYKKANNDKKYISELKTIVKTDAGAGAERTDRTKYLAANAALVLAEPSLDAFYDVKLVKPFKKNLNKKKKRMKTAIDKYNKLIDYEVGDVTAAATYQLAEIYFHFSRALMESERPKNLNELELEQYNLVLEEQAYPFEEKAITVHEKNIELLSIGIYNKWIDRSIEKLAVLMPARYAKSEQENTFVQSLTRTSQQARGVKSDENVKAADATAMIGD